MIQQDHQLSHGAAMRTHSIQTGLIITFISQLLMTGQQEGQKRSKIPYRYSLESIFIAGFLTEDEDAFLVYVFRRL